MKKRDYTPLVGKTFGRWKVKEVLARVPYTSQKVLCKCICGEERVVQVKHLENGKSKSCGCRHKEIASEIGKDNTAYVGGIPSSLHPLYQTWRGMKDRCLSPRATGYENYGGRGIKICQRWLDSFSSFVEDMGERPEGHTLDRIENDGDYEPSNCKWSTPEEQNRNRRWCKKSM